MMIISCYYVQLWMLSILVYHHMGTRGKYHIDTLVFITVNPFVTRGCYLCAHTQTHACMHCATREKTNSAAHAVWLLQLDFTFREIVLCQLKPLVHQKVTFSNIHSPSKLKYATAQFNSDQRPITLTYSSPPYSQSRQQAEKRLKANLSDSAIFAEHFSPSAKEHEMTCQTPSHTLRLLFTIPFFSAVSLSLSLAVLFLPCTFEPSPL